MDKQRFRARIRQLRKAQRGFSRLTAADRDMAEQLRGEACSS